MPPPGGLLPVQAQEPVLAPEPVLVPPPLPGWRKQNLAPVLPLQPFRKS